MKLTLQKGRRHKGRREEEKKGIKALVVGVIAHGKRKKFVKRDDILLLHQTSFANPTLFKPGYIRAF